MERQIRIIMANNTDLELNVFSTGILLYFGIGVGIVCSLTIICYCSTICLLMHVCHSQSQRRREMCISDVNKDEIFKITDKFAYPSTSLKRELNSKMEIIQRNAVGAR